MARCHPAFFDPEWYLRNYPDVAATGINPLRHFLRHGRTEGRLPCAMTAVWRERDLRWGMLEHGIEALTALAARGQGPERVWALLACARASARQGDWVAADKHLCNLDIESELIAGFCLPDPPLLAIEAALMTGDLSRAHEIWRQARRLFGLSSDLRLAAANIQAARSGHGSAWQRHLARLYHRAGLNGVQVSPDSGPQATFDRLQSRGPLLTRRTGPLVSVILPARNAADTIDTALHSLRRQSWRALEILVVDNGSTDATAARARQHAAEDPRIRLLDGAAEPGAYPARNIGLATARGAFITLLDADDWAHPARIARQTRALMRAPARMASVSHWVRTTPDLRFTRWWGETGLIHRNVSSLMIRAELRDTLGFWDRTRAGADTEYYDRIQAVHGPQSIIEVAPGTPLSFGRVRADSLTQTAETGLDSQHYGPRYSYRMASRRWHQRMQNDNALPLPQYPTQRPFPAPPELTLNDPSATSDEPPALFDDHWYMQTYPDLRARNVDGWSHYQRSGDAEGRDPGPHFSTSGYRMAQGLRLADGPALSHYIHIGQAAGHAPLPLFEGDLPPPPSGRHMLFFGHQAKAQIFGAERSLLDTLDRAIAVGVTPSVVLPNIDNAPYLAALRQRAHKIHVLPFGWLFGGVAPHPETQSRLQALIQDSGAVAVHQNTLVLDAPLRAARALGIPTVVHVRELPAEDLPLCQDLGLTAEALRLYFLSLADRFIANSQAVADWLDLSPDRVTILHNTADPALADIPFAPANPPRVALIGSLTAKKGITDILNVARACPPSLAQFLLIGPSTPELTALGSLPPNVQHIGYRPDPVTALTEADVVLSLSHFAESFGRTVLEALSAGRPVICYDRGTPPLLISDSGAGVVVPADDPVAVAQALQHMLSNPAQLHHMSRAARARGSALRARASTVQDHLLFPLSGS
ncbi:glycosyltransferase [Phaeobacter sp. NW0010-22]|uniref:glycosyltransferase n=1 Tax=Phaeobacter sp. NW0010-22 TaxID=3135907 RepID=UPI003107DFCB